MRNFVLWAIAGAMTLCGTAHGIGRSVTVYRDGTVRSQPASTSVANDQAFCNANSTVVLHYTQSITPAPNAQGQIVVTETAGSVALTIAVTLDQVCLPGQTTVRLDYGVLPGGSAVAGTDYVDPGVASITFAGVPQYSSAITQSAGLALAVKNRAGQQPDVSVAIGFRSGSFASLDSSGSHAGAIAGDNTPLATVVIKDSGPTVGDIINTVSGAAAGDPVAALTARPLVIMCTNGTVSPGLQEKCNNIAGAAFDPNQHPQVAVALRAIANEETASQGESVTQTQSVQTSNNSQRMTALRGGVHGFSLNGLTFQQNGITLPLNFLDDAVMRAAQGDAGNGTASPFAESRWGAFMNGSFGHGSRDHTGLENGFDQNTTAITVGGDYRFTPHFIAGLAYGWSRFSSDLGADSGKLDTHTRALTAYATLEMDAWYLQASYGSGPADFDQQRVIRYTVGTDAESATAKGSPSGHADSGNIEAGWYLHSGAWSFTPNLRVDYERVKIDGYTESNAGDFNLIVASQNQESLRYSLGFNVARTYSISQGVLIPGVDLRLYRETKNDVHFIDSHFVEDPSAVLYQLPTEAPDRNYGTLTIGLQGVFAHGVQAYANYEHLFGEQHFSEGIFNIGLRIEL
jgi:outer membrane autotransporter protein